MFRLSLVWELQAGSLVLFTCLYYFHMSLLYPCFLVEQAFPSSFYPYLTLALESAFNDTYKPVHGHQECHCFWPFPWTVRECMYVKERHTHTCERETHTGRVRECMFVREWDTHIHTHTHTHFILAVPIISLVSLFLPSPSPLHRCPPQLLRCQPPPLLEVLNFPAEPSLLEVPSSPHLIGFHLLHQPGLYVNTLLTCPEGSDHLPWAVWPPSTRCWPGSATLHDFGMILSRKIRAVEGKVLV